jgi:hypothetical protein
MAAQDKTKQNKSRKIKARNANTDRTRLHKTKRDRQLTGFARVRRGISAFSYFWVVVGGRAKVKGDIMVREEVGGERKKKNANKNKREKN